MAQQFTGLPMEDLIGGPLNASAKANAGKLPILGYPLLDGRQSAPV